MPDDSPRFLRFVRALALVSGVAIPLGVTVPACATTESPPTDAGIAAADAGISTDAGALPPPDGARDAGIVLDATGVGVSGDPDAAAPPADATADAEDAFFREVTGGPLMPPAFDEGPA